LVAPGIGQNRVREQPGCGFGPAFRFCRRSDVALQYGQILCAKSISYAVLAEFRIPLIWYWMEVRRLPSIIQFRADLEE
jgi:hypothetical protein